MSNYQAEYDFLQNLANTDESGGLARDRAVLLLWFLRNVVGVDDLDAYEFVCDGPDDGGVDGLYLERGTGDEDHDTLVIYQSKYTESPRQVGPNDLGRLISVAANFKDAASLEAFLAAGVEPKLQHLVDRFGLLRRLRDGDYESGRLRIRLAFITSGVLAEEAERTVEATNVAERPNYLTVHDIRRLGPLAQAVAAPTPAPITVTIPVDEDERLIVGEAPIRVAVVPVRATDIVQWDGIGDRTLFELNVRREVRRNRVRDQLDGAIRREDEHSDFLAFHNGLTVVCESFQETATGLTITRPSVVNGAQSVVAFARADGEQVLTDDLRIFVKLVEIEGRPQLAKEVSWRSNTQNAVNPRNLVALGGPQARLASEFRDQYSGIIYETRPDASLAAVRTEHVIENDDAAQLLCAIFNAMPWLAVKRMSLFESENHAMIFNENITASHVVLADLIRELVDRERERFPEVYRQSWRLTRIVAVYLVGQILRTDPELSAILDDPQTALADRQALEEKLDQPVRVAAATLRQRHDGHVREETPDEFNVEFKNREVLQALRDRARDNYQLVAEGLAT
jgi:AIPR protein